MTWPCGLPAATTHTHHTTPRTHTHTALPALPLTLHTPYLTLPHPHLPCLPCLPYLGFGGQTDGTLPFTPPPHPAHTHLPATPPYPTLAPSQTCSCWWSTLPLTLPSWWVVLVVDACLACLALPPSPLPCCFSFISFPLPALPTPCPYPALPPGGDCSPTALPCCCPLPPTHPLACPNCLLVCLLMGVCWVVGDCLYPSPPYLPS